MAEQQTRVESADIVVDKAETKLSDLWQKEDYWAIWLGFLLLVVGMLISAPAAGKHAREYRQG